MEIALLIDDISYYKGANIESYKLSWGSKNNRVFKSIEKALLYVGDIKISYLYFGNEFCEYRIPTVDELKKFLELCDKEKIKPILVTPPVTDKGVRQINTLIEYMVEKNVCIDIAVNDYGVLELLNEKHIDNRIIAGRILDKTSHDSRATSERINRYYGRAGLMIARTPGIVSRQTKKIFNEYAIDRWEFDLPKVGLDLPEGINKSLYWPYSYLTTGRVCSMRAIGLEGKYRYLVGSDKCKQICRWIQIEKHKPLNGYNNESDLVLFQRGNTIFYLYDGENEFENFDRLILQL